MLVNCSSLKVKYDTGVDQINEVNELSSSVIENSHEETKIKISCDTSTKKKLSTENEDPATISKFFNSVDEINDLPVESSKNPARKDSEIGDIYQIHDKLTSKFKKTKDQENSFDLDLRKSFSDKSN